MEAAGRKVYWPRRDSTVDLDALAYAEVGVELAGQVEQMGLDPELLYVAALDTTQAGVVLGLKGFAAAVLGGYGDIMGAVVGGLILGVLESLGAGLISSTFKDVIAFVVLLLVLFVRPQGILGKDEGERV
jgi:hypothetical protein